MKNAIIIIVSLLLTSCFKDYDEKFYFDDLTVEFQDAVINNNALDKDYPVVSAEIGLNKFQVNLIGGIIAESSSIDVRVVKEETTAIEQQHYTIGNNGQIVFAPNAALTTLDLFVPESTETRDVLLVVELMPSENIKSSNNYKKLGIRIK